MGNHSLWTNEEIEVLRREYENGKKIKEIQKEFFPYYTFSQVLSKASVLHLKHTIPRGWSQEELNILKEKFLFYENKEISEKFLPNKTYRAIEAMARKLNLYKEDIEWTPEEDKILRESYNKILVEQIVPLLHKKDKKCNPN